MINHFSEYKNEDTLRQTIFAGITHYISIQYLLFILKFYNIIITKFFNCFEFIKFIQ